MKLYFCLLQKSNITSEDSDSDSEFKRLAETSRTQLMISESRYGTMAETSFVRITLAELFRLLKYFLQLLSRMKDRACESLHRSYNILRNIALKKVGGSVMKLFFPS